MANDRMWLVHKPTGKMALIAKHFGGPWVEYTGDRHAPYFSIPDLLAQDEEDNTNFVICYESRPEDWKDIPFYKEDE